MGLGSPKSMASAYPKTLVPIAASIGGLALFLVFASLLLVDQPIGSKVSGYFFNLDQASKVDLSPFNNETSIFEIKDRANDTDTTRKIVDSATNKTVDTNINKTIESDVNKTIDSGINKTVDAGIKKSVDSGTNIVNVFTVLRGYFCLT